MSRHCSVTAKCLLLTQSGHRQLNFAVMHNSISAGRLDARLRGPKFRLAFDGRGSLKYLVGNIDCQNLLTHFK
jgi:hypothetical protein